jgi:hypothetical protein
MQWASALDQELSSRPLPADRLLRLLRRTAAATAACAHHAAAAGPLTRHIAAVVADHTHRMLAGVHEPLQLLRLTELLHVLSTLPPSVADSMWGGTSPHQAAALPGSEKLSHASGGGTGLSSHWPALYIAALDAMPHVMFQIYELPVKEVRSVRRGIACLSSMTSI